MIVDVIIYFIKDNKLQVFFMSWFEYFFRGMWVFFGGFVDLVKDCDLVDIVKCKLKIKIGVLVLYFEQVVIFSGVQCDFWGWLVIVVYYVLFDWDEINIGLSDDFVKWVLVDEV